MDGFFKEAALYVKSGGVLMLPLFMLAAYLYYAAFMLLFKLLKFYAACRNSDLIKRNLCAFFNAETLEDALGGRDMIKARFDAVRREIMPPVSRSLAMIKILAAIAPLLGLLGTVSGMAFALSGRFTRIDYDPVRAFNRFARHYSRHAMLDAEAENSC